MGVSGSYLKAKTDALRIHRRWREHKRIDPQSQIQTQENELEQLPNTYRSIKLILYNNSPFSLVLRDVRLSDGVLWMVSPPSKLQPGDFGVFGAFVKEKDLSRPDVPLRGQLAYEGIVPTVQFFTKEEHRKAKKEAAKKRKQARKDAAIESALEAKVHQLKERQAFKKREKSRRNSLSSPSKEGTSVGFSIVASEERQLESSADRSEDLSEGPSSPRGNHADVVTNANINFSSNTTTKAGRRKSDKPPSAKRGRSMSHPKPDEPPLTASSAPSQSILSSKAVDEMESQDPQLDSLDDNADEASSSQSSRRIRQLPSVLNKLVKVPRTGDDADSASQSPQDRRSSVSSSSSAAPSSSSFPTSVAPVPNPSTTTADLDINNTVTKLEQQTHVVVDQDASSSRLSVESTSSTRASISELPYLFVQWQVEMDQCEFEQKCSHVKVTFDELVDHKPNHASMLLEVQERDPSEMSDEASSLRSVSSNAEPSSIESPETKPQIEQNSLKNQPSHRFVPLRKVQRSMSAAYLRSAAILKKSDVERLETATYFDADEIRELHVLFSKVAGYTSHITPETFDVFLPELSDPPIRRAVFSAFDKSREYDDKISFDEFVNTLSYMCRGTMDERAEVVFDMCSRASEGRTNFVLKRENVLQIVTRVSAAMEQAGFTPRDYGNPVQVVNNVFLKQESTSERAGPRRVRTRLATLAKGLAHPHHRAEASASRGQVEADLHDLSYHEDDASTSADDSEDYEESAPDNIGKDEGHAVGGEEHKRDIFASSKPEPQPHRRKQILPFLHHPHHLHHPHLPPGKKKKKKIAPRPDSSAHPPTNYSSTPPVAESFAPSASSNDEISSSSEQKDKPEATHIVADPIEEPKSDKKIMAPQANVKETYSSVSDDADAEHLGSSMQSNSSKLSASSRSSRKVGFQGVSSDEEDVTPGSDTELAENPNPSDNSIENRSPRSAIPAHLKSSIGKRRGSPHPNGSPLPSNHRGRTQKVNAPVIYEELGLNKKQFKIRCRNEPDLTECFGLFDFFNNAVVEPITKLSVEHSIWQRVAMAGFMTKDRGSMSRKIGRRRDKRYFMLKDGFLGYSKRPDGPLLRVISLWDASIKPHISDRKFALTIIAPFFHRKLWLQSPQQAQLWVHALRTVLKGKTRFKSFAPIRKNISVRPLMNGKEYFDVLAPILQKCKRRLYISGWYLSPGLLLKRGAMDAMDRFRLDNLILEAASRGVSVYIIIYAVPSFSDFDLQPSYVCNFFNNLHPNIHALMHPNYYVPSMWSHHQKLVVCDESIAFIGGIDLCYGRYDDSDYSIVDVDETNFPGRDYCNVFLENESNGPSEVSLLDRKTQPRMPWMDVQVQVNGMAAFDIGLNFVQRWCHIVREGTYECKPMPFLFPSHSAIDEDQKIGTIDAYTGQSFPEIPVQESLATAAETASLTSRRRSHSASQGHAVDDNEIDSADTAVSDAIDYTDNPRNASVSKPSSPSSSSSSSSSSDSDYTPRTSTDNDAFTKPDEQDRLSDGTQVVVLPEIPWNCLTPYENLSVAPEELGYSGCNVQIVRSVSSWSAGTSAPEQSIYKAYLSLIREAKHTIFISNQYFISSIDQSSPKNRILEALYLRIKEAIEMQQDFRVLVLCPCLPGGGSIEAASTRYMLKYTFRSISRGGSSILEKLQEDYPDIDVHAYIKFGTPRQIGRLGDTLLSEPVYIHSKVLIIDDNAAIIGSANINDRSLRGTRDSEIACVIEPGSPDSTFRLSVKGQLYDACKPIHALRVRMWAEMLGVKMSSGREEDLEMIKALRDPHTGIEMLMHRAEHNTKAYLRVFPGMMPNVITKISDFAPARVDIGPEEDPIVREQRLEDMTQIKGIITTWPFDFLKDEPMSIGVFEKEYMVPRIIFL